MEQFNLILESALQYEQKQCAIVSVMLIILIAILSFVVVKKRKTLSVSNKVTITLIIVALCVVYIGYLVFTTNYQKAITRDMSQGAFETYIGDYTHDDYQKDSFWHNVYITDGSEEKIVLRYPYYGNHYHIRNNYIEFPVGTYNGELVYGKHSKILLDWDMYDE